MPHVPALDGLRGLALLGVLSFHANGALPGGYLGVDLFFVLSGYLITSLLLVEFAATGRIELAAFWSRRARRLFPALLSLMPAVAIYARYFARSEELATVRAQALAALAYVENWQAIYRHQSYWQLFAAPTPLEHTWSLSIEEQFYVAWPLLVGVVLRRWGARGLALVCLLLATLSMVAMARLYDPANSARAYLGTDTRLAGIALGAALATALTPGRTLHNGLRRWLDAAGLLAFVGLGLAWCRLRGSDPRLYHGGFWVTEGFALVLIACAVSNQRGLVARALSLRPFTALGAVSYGVYLWHWPVNVFFTPERVHLSGLGLHALRFALTFAIAIASYRFLEQPIRRHGVPFSRPLYIVPGALACAVFLVVHATFAEGRPATTHLPPSAVALRTNAVRFRIAVFGDSTANSLGWGLRGLREPGVDIALEGIDGCDLLSDSACDSVHWPQQIRALHPNASVVYVAGAFLHGFHVNGVWLAACHAEWDAKLQRTLSARFRDIALESGRVFTATIPYPVGPYEANDADRDEFHARIDCINRSIRAAVADAPGVTLIDFATRLCPNGVCEQDVGARETVRPDGVHFSIEAARAPVRWLYRELLR